MYVLQGARTHDQRHSRRREPTLQAAALVLKDCEPASVCASATHTTTCILNCL